MYIILYYMYVTMFSGTKNGLKIKFHRAPLYIRNVALFIRLISQIKMILNTF